MLLFSLVLIYLSNAALSILISCLLSFWLIVCVTPNTQFSIFTPNARGWTFSRHDGGSCCSVSVWPDMAEPRLPGLAISTARLPRNSFCRLRPPHPQSLQEVEWQGRTGQAKIEKENVEIDWKETRMTGEIKDDTQTSCHSKFWLGSSYVCACLHVCTWM